MTNTLNTPVEVLEKASSYDPAWTAKSFSDIKATLTPAQIAYAATDAWACRELYLRFESLGMLTLPAPTHTPTSVSQPT